MDEPASGESAGEMHPALLSPDEILKDCDTSFTRRSGPGGQHRNKTSTAVVLTHRPTGITAEASERRSQVQNRSVALDRLRQRLALSIRSPQPELPVRGQTIVDRYRGARLRISSENPDFPGLLAIVLDKVLAADGELRPAAELLGTSSSQIIRFLRSVPEAFERVNAARTATGKHRLK